jgi:hypothetical protein
MKYDKLPSYSTWQKDSSVTFAIRKHDIVLDRIDGLLEHYWTTKDSSQQFIFLCDLYFTLDYWLKVCKTNTRMEKGREPAVFALFARVVEDLCASFGCTINGLPRELELMWGRELSAPGVNVDIVRNQAEYITRAQAAQYRLFFKNGKAYMLPWYYPSVSKPKLELAESRHAYVKEAQVRSGDAVNYGFFVLSMSRDLYMAKHRMFDSNGPKGFYHSSYVAGEPVQCSGTMLIERGKIRRVRLNSGHYMPQLNNLRALIMALRMWGVPVNDIVFEDFKGNPIGTKGSVMDVVEATNNRTALNQGREKTVADNQLAFNRKPSPDMSKSPDPRTWWGNRPRQPEVAPPALRAL